MRQTIAGFFFLWLSFEAAANEGLWPVTDDAATSPQKNAFETNWQLSRAIVNLNGCTATVVSSTGLLLTNHHCAVDTLEKHSTDQIDYVERGYLAETGPHELPAPSGTTLKMLIDVRDVTARILEQTGDSIPTSRSEAIARNLDAVLRDCEGGPGVQCQVVPYFGGNEFQLIRSLILRDIRLVYAPPNSIAAFGGETDNWMWPRQAGDFAFFRAYVSPEGLPAEYSPSNVPYLPSRYLTLSSAGGSLGEPVEMLGYPTITHRHATPSAVASTFETLMPLASKIDLETRDVILRETANRPAARRRYGPLLRDIANRLKKRDGQLASYQQTSLLAKKRVEFASLREWVAASSGEAPLAQIDQLERDLDSRADEQRRVLLLNAALPRPLLTAVALFESAIPGPKDSQETSSAGRSDSQILEKQLDEDYSHYDRRVDQSLAAHFLRQYIQYSAGEKHRWLSILGVGPNYPNVDINKHLGLLYTRTGLNRAQLRRAWQKQTPSAFLRSPDVFVRAGASYFNERIVAAAESKERNERIESETATYLKMLRARAMYLKCPLYPDANDTLRASFGEIIGREKGTEDGTSWLAFTTLQGIVAKRSQSGDFRAPEREMEAIRAGNYGDFAIPALQSVPVNFLASLDISNGSSGSPILNRRSEIVGIAFDWNLDAVLSDWAFDPKRVRVIAVDSRYMLWVLSEVDKANGLLEELGFPVSHPK